MCVYMFVNFHKNIEYKTYRLLIGICDYENMLLYYSYFIKLET